MADAESSLNVPKPQLVANDDKVDWENCVMLVSNPDDDKGYVVPKKSKRHSEFLKELLSEDGPMADERVVLPVNNLATESVQAVAWFLNAFAEEGKTPRATELARPFPHPDIVSHVSPFEGHFADTLFPKVGEKNLKGLVGILHAANFLQVKPLLILAAVGLTFHFRGKTPSEIKDLMAGQEPLKAKAE